LGTHNCTRNSFRCNISFRILNIFTLISTALCYLINQFLIKELSKNLFVHNYLNDLLVMLIILPYSNLLLSLFKNTNIRLKGFLHIIIFSLACGVVWEYVTPLYYANSVTDFMDILMFMLGGFLYFISIKLSFYFEWIHKY